VAETEKLNGVEKGSKTGSAGRSRNKRARKHKRGWDAECSEPENRAITMMKVSNTIRATRKHTAEGEEPQPRIGANVSKINYGVLLAGAMKDAKEKPS
jgi:hypothetical protein